MMQGIPGYGVGFARSADESDAPEQWRGQVGGWAPFLGNQGGTLYDINGYGRHLTLTNVTLTSAWGLGARGPQLTWDGTNDYADVVDTTLFHFPDQAFTVSLWVKMGALAANAYLINTRDTLTAPGGWFIRANADGTLTVRIMGPAAGVAAARSSVAILAVGVYAMVTVVFITDTVTAAVNDIQIFVNASLSQGVNTGDGSVYTPSTLSLKMGVEADFVAATYINAAMDDIRIYDRALTEREILAIYTDPLARYRRRQRRVRSAPAAAVALIAQERSLMRRVGGRVFGRVN